jgi:uncharacterized protein YecE (DUF72 family)
VQRRELSYAAERLSSIEINGTFYSLQRPKSFRTWYEQTPDDFVFAVKGPRFVTHMKKLNDVEAPLANFFASGVLALGEKLGPVLWQLPPQLAFHPDRLAEFFGLLPRTHTEAVALTARRDHRLADDQVVLASTTPDRPIHYALEVRHQSFRDPALLDLLRAHDVAIVDADTAGIWPQIEELTTDFAYVRLHGSEQLYVTGYDDAALDAWATKIRSWAERGDVYCYFDNDVKVRAPFDAMALIDRLG